MKRFRFTLDALLTLRRRQENDAMDHYGRALLRRQRALEQLAEAQAELQRACREVEGLFSEGCPAARLAQAQSFCRLLQGRRQDREAALGQAERELNLALHEMNDARKQRKVVEKFRDKQRARHERELVLEEQKLMDEFAQRSGGALTARWPSGLNA